MTNGTAIRATVTGAKDGYSVTVVLEKGGQSLTLAEKTVNSRVAAEAVARAFAAHHEVPWDKGRGALPLTFGRCASGGC
jgi:hypothetical protein